MSRDVSSAFSDERDSAAAAGAIASQIGDIDARAIVFFCQIFHDGAAISRALRTRYRFALPPQAFGAEVTQHRGVGRHRRVRQSEPEIVVVQLNVPLGMRGVLRLDRRRQFAADRTGAPGIGSRHGGEQRGRIGTAPGQRQPAFEGGHPKAHLTTVQRMAPGLGAELGQALLEFAPGRGRSQQLADDQQAQPGPLIPGAGTIGSRHGKQALRTLRQDARGTAD